MTTVLKEYVCHFGTYKTGNNYRSGARPEAWSEPSTQHLYSATPDAAGWLYCEDPTVIGAGLSEDLDPTHFKQLRIPRLPANSTNISADCVWGPITAHVVNRSENMGVFSGGNYTIEHGLSLICIAFTQFSGVSTGQSTATGFFQTGRGIGRLGPHALEAFDGTQDWGGTSGWSITSRAHGLEGVAPMNSVAYPANPVTPNHFRDGNPDYPEQDYIAIMPVASFAMPNRIWSGNPNPGVYRNDLMWAAGTFTIRITYDIP